MALSRSRPFSRCAFVSEHPDAVTALLLPPWPTRPCRLSASLLTGLPLDEEHTFLLFHHVSFLVLLGQMSATADADIFLSFFSARLCFLGQGGSLFGHVQASSSAFGVSLGGPVRRLSVASWGSLTSSHDHGGLLSPTGRSPHRPGPVRLCTRRGSASRLHVSPPPHPCRIARLRGSLHGSLGCFQSAPLPPLPPATAGSCPQGPRASPVRRGCRAALGVCGPDAHLVPALPPRVPGLCRLRPGPRWSLTRLAQPSRC